MEVARLPGLPGLMATKKKLTLVLHVATLRTTKQMEPIVLNARIHRRPDDELGYVHKFFIGKTHEGTFRFDGFSWSVTITNKARLDLKRDLACEEAVFNEPVRESAGWFDEPGHETDRPAFDWFTNETHYSSQSFHFIQAFVNNFVRTLSRGHDAR